MTTRSNDTTRYSMLHVALLLSCVATACSGSDGETGVADGTLPSTPPLFQNGTETAREFPKASAAVGDGRVAMNLAPGGTAAVPDTADDEVLSKGLIQTTTQSNAEIFQWSTGGANVPDVLMRPTNTHLCVLTRVGGNFNGKSGVVVHHNNTDSYTRCAQPGARMIISTVPDDTGPIWKLGGCQRQGNSLTAEATCVPASNFTTDPGGIVTGSSSFHTEAHESCSGSKTVPMWPGIAVSFLNGMLGRFEGGGEVLKTINGATPLDPTILSAQNRYCDGFNNNQGVDAWGYSVFANVLDGQHVTRRSYQTSISSNNGPKKVRLATTHQALCYLVRLSGQYDGAEERIRIAPEIDPTFGTEWWTLSTHAGGGDAYATAECVAYDQATIILQ